MAADIPPYQLGDLPYDLLKKLADTLDIRSPLGQSGVIELANYIGLTSAKIWDLQNTNGSWSMTLFQECYARGITLDQIQAGLLRTNSIAAGIIPRHMGLINDFIHRQSTVRSGWSRTDGDPQQNTESIYSNISTGNPDNNGGQYLQPVQSYGLPTPSSSNLCSVNRSLPQCTCPHPSSHNEDPCQKGYSPNTEVKQVLSWQHFEPNDKQSSERTRRMAKDIRPQPIINAALDREEGHRDLQSLELQNHIYNRTMGPSGCPIPQTPNLSQYVEGNSPQPSIDNLQSKNLYYFNRFHPESIGNIQLDYNQYVNNNGQYCRRELQPCDTRGNPIPKNPVNHRDVFVSGVPPNGLLLSNPSSDEESIPDDRPEFLPDRPEFIPDRPEFILDRSEFIPDQFTDVPHKRRRMTQGQTSFTLCVTGGRCSEEMKFIKAQLQAELQTLEPLGVHVLWDKANGDPWGDKWKKRFQQADCVVIGITKDYAKSANENQKVPNRASKINRLVQNELKRRGQSNARFLSVLFSDTGLKRQNVPSELHVAMYSWPAEKLKLLTRVRDKIGQRARDRRPDLDS